MISVIQKAAHYLFEHVEAGFSLIFDDDWNPFHHLGALAFFFFWVVGATGLYLFVFFETSIYGAYSSIQYLTNEQWYLGGVMRSLHRYCSDALAITVTLHLLREFSLGRYTGVRWFSWVSGIPLLWIMFAAAIGGYWLVWDQFAQYVAVVTMEWFDWLPNFGNPMARNFLTNESVSDRFFSLMVFLHIGIPLTMLLVMFIHISRITDAKTNPPKGLVIGSMLAFIVLSLLKPAVSADPADLGQTQLNIPMDWFYLNVYPLIESWGAGEVWGLLVGFSSFLTILPWLVRAKKKAVAVVDPEHCNGCGWCDQDCPYSAIDYVAHPKNSELRLAVVDPDKCTACGICSGACPTATPFQHVDELRSGIELPQFPLDQFKQQTLQLVDELEGSNRIIVFGCDQAAQVESLKQKGVVYLSLPCIGFLPPSFVDFVLKKDKVDGVIITGCCADNCYFRSGNTWIEERLDGERSPHLRTKATNRANIHVHWAGALELKELEEEITLFKKAISERQPIESLRKTKPIKKGKNLFAQAIAYAVFVFFIGYFSTSPSFSLVPDGYATVKLSLRHSGQMLGECRFLSAEELQRLPPNMRQARVCPRERSSVEFQFMMDGQEIYHKVVKPAGLKNDGRAMLYYRFKIKAGDHTITAKLKDHQDLNEYNFKNSKTIRLKSGSVLVVDFDADKKKFIFIVAGVKEQ